MKITMPDGAREIIDRLYCCGHEGYIVGGCVRDSILGRIPNDWDICTSATPKEMLNIFKDKKIIETGLQHGTVTVVIGTESYEVTTYRIDGDYSDSRHPDNVSFTKNLIEDLSRRDFTINAMAYNDDFGLIDPFNGLEDMDNKVIRCVGSPVARFNEDALRMLRAIRFACQLNFTIDPSIGWCIGYTDIINNLRNISAERINSEFVKMIVCNNFHEKLIHYYKLFEVLLPEITCMIGFDHKNPHHIYDVFHHTLVALKNCSTNDLVTRLAILFHDFGKPATCFEENGIRRYTGHWEEGRKLTNEIMRRLKFDNNTRVAVETLVYWHDYDIGTNKPDVKKMLGKIEKELFFKLLDIKRADASAHTKNYEENKLKNINVLQRIAEEVIKNNECYSLKSLAVNGNDLISLGYEPGKELGEILNELLLLVIEGTKNDKVVLLDLAKRMYENKKYK